MAVPLILAGLAVASSVTSTVAAYKKNKAEREAALNQQALRTLEVAEMERRAAINQELMSRKLNDNAQTSLASISTSTGAMTSESIRSQLFSDIQSELQRAKIESAYEINMRQREADAAGTTAASINRLTPITIISGGLSAAQNGYTAGLQGKKDFYSLFNSNKE